jgi:hypothetical protein
MVRCKVDGSGKKVNFGGTGTDRPAGRGEAQKKAEKRGVGRFSVNLAGGL